MEKKRKKILFDGTATQGFKYIKYHGGGEYAKFMLRTMIDRGLEFDVVFDTSAFLDDHVLKLAKERLKGKVMMVSGRQEIYDLIESGGYDTFYAAMPYHYTDYNCKARIIAVIHGLRRLESPWDRYRHLFFKESAKKVVGTLISRSMSLQKMVRKREKDRFDKVLAIPGANYVAVSNHSKYSILNFYPQLRPEDIKVFYSPFSTGSPVIDTDTSDYYLMVSANRSEKNIYPAAMTFDRLFSQGRLPGKRVVITGTDNEPIWKRLKCPERFTLLPYVEKHELDELYSKAFCFVYPSLNEGFGYPPLISMSYGVPVIASAATSIPEACDNAALYFPPTNLDDLANRLLQVDSDPSLRTMYRKRGFERVKVLQDKQKVDLDAYIDFIFS